MKSINRKNILTSVPLGESAPELWSIFERIENGLETAQSRRVRRILELLNLLGENPHGMDEVKAISELGALLRRYVWVTHAKVSRTKEGYRAIFRQEPEGAKLSREDVWEYEAVKMLLDLANSPDALSRLRRCRNGDCRKWLFVVSGKRRFCDNGGVCKQHHFDSDEKQREKKRVYMRKYYAEYGNSPRVGLLKERQVTKHGRAAWQRTKS